MAVLAGGETIAANRYLYSKLNAEPELAGKVFPGLAARGTSMPYVIYQLMPLPGVGDTVALGGIRVLSRLRYLVKVISSTLAEAEPLVIAVDGALQVTEGPSGGYYVSDVQRAEPYEMPTTEDDELYWQTGGFYDLYVSAGI